MSLPTALWTPRGRLSRGGFWLRCALLWLAYALLGTLLDGWPAATWLLGLPVLWALVCGCVQRLHDRNLGAAWLLAALLPILGALWLFVQLGCRRGVADDNRWGPDPLAHHADFLVVR